MLKKVVPLFDKKGKKSQRKYLFFCPVLLMNHGVMLSEDTVIALMACIHKWSHDLVIQIIDLMGPTIQKFSSLKSLMIQALACKSTVKMQQHLFRKKGPATFSQLGFLNQKLWGISHIYKSPLYTYLFHQTASLTAVKWASQILYSSRKEPIISLIALCCPPIN